jgi:hypothetical protein
MSKYLQLPADKVGRRYRARIEPFGSDCLAFVIVHAGLDAATGLPFPGQVRIKHCVSTVRLLTWTRSTGHIFDVRRGMSGRRGPLSIVR